MGAVDDLSAGNMRDIDRRLRALETATPLNHASIGAGGVRVHSGGVITIQNGGLSVTGTAAISGVLNADGTVTLSGVVNISGPFTVTGTTALNGPTTVGGNTTVNGTLTTNGATDINGNLTVDGTAAINGVATLSNDLNVTGGGKIVAGAVTVDPSHLSGSVKFSNGSYVAATPNGAQLAVPSGGAAYASASQAGVTHGGVGVAVDATGPFISGMPTTAAAANLYQDPATGRIYRSTA